MTWLWPICFSLALIPAAAATVTIPVQLADSRDNAVRKRNYAGVVVLLEPGAAVDLMPTPGARLTQKNKRFTPHVLPVTVGTTVEFPNLDPIFHNAFSNFAGQPFDTGLYRPGSSHSVTFRRAGVVRVFCNIHSTMSAVILVLRTPYFAVSGADGTVRISGVPPDDYLMKVFHERATEATLRSLERRVTVGADATLAPVRVSESGFIVVPHRNKHGLEYPATRADDRVYSGGRK